MKTICSWTRQHEIRPNIKKLQLLTQDAALEAGISGNPNISVVFLPAAKMAELNEAALGHHGPTDVISFDLRTPGFPDDPDSASVEIYVCPDVARTEAEKRALPYSREVVLYIAHGLLHIAGEDDLVPEKKRKMRRAEKRVLAALEKKYNFERIFLSASSAADESL